MQRALISGAHGFLGRHLRRELAAQGWAVAGFGRSAPLSDAADSGETSYFQCDITDSEAIQTVVRTTQPEAIFHLAALMPVHKPADEDYYRVNVLGTRNLLEAARQWAPSAAIVLTTSSAMYGRAVTADAVIDEAAPLLPVNAYGVSKAAAHLLGYQYADQFKLRVIRICPFNLIGPELPRGLVASDFAYQLAAIEAGQQPPRISVGDLNAARDFLDVRDAIRAFRLIAEVGEPGDFFNIASGHAVRIRDLLDILIGLTGLVVDIEVRPGANAANPIPIQVGSHARLSRAIDWMPTIRLEQSLADVLNTYRRVVRGG